jgi:hypothetical protein
MVRCRAHLSNLALGGSKMALRLFGTKVVQEAFESEVVSALQRATDTDVSICCVVSSLPRASDARMKGDRRALHVYERHT